MVESITSAIDETTDVDTICQYIEDAAQEAKETGDYLSYATLLDVYVSDPTEYSDVDKVKILNKLHDVLSDNLELLYEIGWDLPELLSKFYEIEWGFNEGMLRDSHVIVANMKCFDLVAKNANPKELFLKAIEILNSLEDSDISDDKHSKILDIRLHTMIELLSSSLKRIKTIYPSRFLAMATTSLLKMFSWYIQKTVPSTFILRRLYTFARDYISPSKPDGYLESHGITQKDADKIQEDEEYLQRKLLQSFLTQSCGIALRVFSLHLTLEFYKFLQLKNLGKLPADEDGEELSIVISSRTLLSRITELGLSFDLCYEDCFEKLKRESIELLQRIDKKKSEDEKIQDVLKFAINDRVSNSYHPETEIIPMNQTGLLYLSSQYTKEINTLLPIKINEAIAIMLRFVSPTLVTSTFNSVGALDASLFWCWASIVDAKPQDFAEIPHYQIILYLQLLIFLSSTNENPSYRLVTYTLLTRSLILLKEEISYNFLIDTLSTAPFNNAKVAVITILKDFIIRPKQDVDELANAVSKISVSSDSKAPKLPQRYYINLNNNRIDDIYALIRESIDETFINEGDFDTESSKITLGYLNLLIGIKDKFNREYLKQIVSVINEKADKFIELQRQNKIDADKISDEEGDETETETETETEVEAENTENVGELQKQTSNVLLLKLANESLESYLK